MMTEDPALKLELKYRKTYSVSPYEQLHYRVERELANLINTEIEGNRKIDILRSSLNDRYDFNNYDVFHAIDWEHNGMINRSDLRMFMKKAGYGWNYELPELIIRRMDRDEDGKLSYSEFSEGIGCSKNKSEYVSKYSMSEKKPRYHSILPGREPMSEQKHRTFSEEKYGSRQQYFTPSKTMYGKSYVSPEKASYVSPSKTFYGTSYISPAKTVLKPTMLDYEEPAAFSKKLEYSQTISPSKKMRVDDQLITALNEQIRLEKKVENYRQDLSLQYDFNFVDAFYMLNPNCESSMTFADFYMGVKNLGIMATYNDMKLLFDRYATGIGNTMRYSDFCRIIRPKKLEYDMKMKGIYSEKREFSRTTLLYFKLLLETSIEAEKENELLRKKLRRSYDFNAYDAFRSIDYMGKGKVSMPEVN